MLKTLKIMCVNVWYLVEMDFLSFSFLIIEKRVSKAGYHKKLTAKEGDTYEELFTKSITINEIEIAKTYIPESPK